MDAQCFQELKKASLRQLSSGHATDIDGTVVDDARAIVSLMRVLVGGEKAVTERDRQNLMRIGFVTSTPSDSIAAAVLAFVDERPHLRAWLQALPDMLRDAANAKAGRSASLLGREHDVMPITAGVLAAGQSRGGALARLSFHTKKQNGFLNASSTNEGRTR